MEYRDSSILRHALIGPDTDNARALPLTSNMFDPEPCSLTFIKGEHWWRTIIGGVKIWGKINRFALQFFSNFALYKRYQPLKIKIFNFLSS